MGRSKKRETMLGIHSPRMSFRMHRQCISSISRRLNPVCVALSIGVALVLALPHSARAAVFNCAAGNVTCLIDAINAANSNGEADSINLDGSTFTLNAV